MPRQTKARQQKIGGGRSTLRAKQARDAGDIEEADRLAPPSEKRTRPEDMCAARNAAKDAKNEFCTNPKGWGTDHPGYGNCKKHGGNTEAGIKAAMRLMGQDLIERYREEWRFGGNRHDPSIANMTPEQAMLEEVRRSIAMVRFLEERIARWNLNSTQLDTIEKFVTAPKTGTKGRGKDVFPLRDAVEEFMNALPDEDPDSPWHLPPLMQVHHSTGISSFTDLREWLYLYREERSHLARVSKLTLDAGVAQRLVAIAEDQGQMLASAIRAVLNALQLTPEQAERVPIIVPPILRAVAMNQPIPDVTSLVPATHPLALPVHGDG